jgi:hypothetical protein
MRNRSVVFAACVSVACSVGCGGTTHSSAFEQGDASSASSGSTSGGAGASDGSVAFMSDDASVVSTGDDSSDCPESAKLVYVTGSGSQLWSFDPQMVTFNLIGTFDCLDEPSHMTVDRQGVAWVEADGNIYKASTNDAKCTQVATWSSQDGFDDFALSFVGVTNTIDNTLYMMGDSSLAKVDIPSGNLTTIGNAPGSKPAAGDMTSSGDGSLYFLADVEKPVLYQVSTTDGSVLAKMPIAASGGGDQALAFWGGDFYVFEDDTIYQYDPKAMTTTSLGKAPLQVTGAGQSTCVPKTQPPK